MSTYLENLQTARGNLAEELVDETTRRLALTAAGKPAPTQYKFGSQMFDWNGYLAAMTATLKAMDDLIAANNGPYEHVETAWIDT